MHSDGDWFLVVEDNADDALLVERAFSTTGLQRPRIVRDGPACLAALRDSGHRGRPAVILLDLKLPGPSGLEVLRQIRASERTQFVPVVVISTSMEDTDVRSAYELGANGYLRKPVDFDEFARVIALCGAYWSANVPTAPASI